MIKDHLCMAQTARVPKAQMMKPSRSQKGRQQEVGWFSSPISKWWFDTDTSGLYMYVSISSVQPIILFFFLRWGGGSGEAISVLLLQIDDGVPVEEQGGEENGHQGQTNAHVEHVRVQHLQSFKENCVSLSKYR